jgi:hypothetical protein
MSRVTPTAGGSSTVRVVASMVFVLAMAIVVLLLVRARPAPEPFDPRSGRPDGARGLVLTLEEFGASVTDTSTPPGAGEETRVLVLEDRLDDEQRADLLDFVEAGGLAVVADPDSTLHGGAGVDGGAEPVLGDPLPDQRLPVIAEANVVQAACTVETLVALDGVYVPDGVLFPVGPTEDQCFSSDGSSFLVSRMVGDGVVVGLGDNEPFVNEHLRRADNAAVAVGLLVPDGEVTVTVLVGRGASRNVADVGTGDETLLDLVPPWVWMGLVLGAIAFVVFAVSQSARTGRVLTEPFATPIAGSELVSATGNLMDRARHSEHAGWLLRNRLHRDLCRYLRVDVAAPLSQLDQVAVRRLGIAPGEVENLLRSDSTSDAELVATTHRIDRLRTEVLTKGTTS